MKKLYIICVLFLVSLGSLFGFTTTYADWYGLTLFETSPGTKYFAELCDIDIDLLSRLLVYYTFEYNANPKQPSILTSGFTFYSTIMNILPLDFKYDVKGLDYNLSAKLLGIRLGNSPSELILGFGGSVGLNLESVELLVGNSNSSSDFTNVDFKHLNRVCLLNLFGTLHAYVEIPINSYNFPSIMYVFNYSAGITVLGPFLPNLESVSTQENFEKTFSNITHSIAIRFRF